MTASNTSDNPTPIEKSGLDASSPRAAAATSTELAFNEARREIKRIAASVKGLNDSVKKNEHEKTAVEDRGEVIANLQLAYRALEDASMRVGKAIQAHNGGVSVYDRDSTVGA